MLNGKLTMNASLHVRNDDYPRKSKHPTAEKSGCTGGNLKKEEDSTSKWQLGQNNEGIGSTLSMILKPAVDKNDR